MASKIRLAAFQYDIPEDVAFPNPTPYLRARNDHGKVFAFRTQGSVWLIDRDNPPLALQARMEAAGCTVDIYPLDMCDEQKYMERAAVQMRKDLLKKLKAEEKSLAEADAKLAQAEADHGTGVIGWDALAAARKAHATVRKNALGRTENLVRDLEAAAAQFNIPAPTDAFKAVRGRVGGLRVAASARAEVYMELARAVRGTAMEAAAKESEVPVGILMDYAEEHGVDVSTAREVFAEPERETAVATVAPPVKKQATEATPRYRTDNGALTWSPAHKSFTAEASGLGLTGAPAKIELQSHRTGNVITLVRGAVTRNGEQEVVRVDYKGGDGITLHLLND
jgi:hypothetical protein